MNAHDLYVVSPYLAMAGAGLLVIIFDLLLPRRIHGLLPYLAFLLLAGPFILSLVQFYDLGLAANLVRDGTGVGEASILLGSLSVDRFALFFNFLVTGAVGLGGAGFDRLRAAAAQVPGRVFRTDAFLGHRHDAAGGGDRTDNHLRSAWS